MVYMSNQETKTSTGRYAPSVNYNQQAPQAINQRLQSRVEEPKVDWTSLGEDVFKSIQKGYASAQEKKAEAALNTAKNDLARQANMIAEEQRQTGMSAATAASRYRMLADNALAGGTLTEKDIADVIGRYDGGILNIDQSRQQKIMEADQKYWENQSQEIADKNPALSRMQPSDRTKLLMEMRTLTDDVNKYRGWMSSLPEGEEKESAKAYYNQLMGSNIKVNMAIQLGNMFAQAKVVTEEDWVALRAQAVQACLDNGMDRGTAGVLVDEVANSYSVTGDLTDIKRYFKDNTNYLEAANKMVLANAENKVVSLPGLALLQAMPQELQKSMLNQNWPTYQLLTRPFLANINTDSKGNKYLEGLDRISPNFVAPLAQAVNNMNSSGMYNDYVRGKTTGMALSAVNNVNRLSPTSSASDAGVVALNSDGTRQYINFNLSRKQADALLRSADPEEVATGEFLTQELDMAEEQQWLADNIPVADKIVKTLTNLNGGDEEAYRANNSLQRSTNAASLRFNDNGELFISDADRNILSDVGLGFDISMPFGGEYEEELATINNKLSILEPEMRKLVLTRAGYKQAGADELPISLKTPKMFGKSNVKPVDIAEDPEIELSEDVIEESRELNKELFQPTNKQMSYTLRSSEPLAFANLSADDLSIWEDVEAASAADTKASQGLSEYDTDLGASGEAHYQEWKRSLPAQLQSDTDYDLRGYYKDTNGGEVEGHLTDVYKKPNHPTFSKESKYYKKGMWAGEWTEDGDFKIPLTTPKAKLKELVDYWRSGAEPTANLIVDNPKAEKEIDKLEKRLAKYVEQLNNDHESADTKRLVRKEVNKLRQQISNLYRLIYVNTAGE